MAKRYVDSNIFFYAKINDTTYGLPCSIILRAVATGKLEVAALAIVLVEVANALSKYGLQEEVAREVHAICSLKIDIHTIDASDIQEAVEIYKTVRISPYDCLHAAIMRKYGLKEIISADKDFDRVKWLKRVDPKSISASIR